MVRDGIVRPYSLGVAGGVRARVLDLARALVGLGHDVDVFAPAGDETEVPPFVTRAGRAVAAGFGVRSVGEGVVSHGVGVFQCLLTEFWPHVSLCVKGSASLQGRNFLTD